MIGWRQGASFRWSSNSPILTRALIIRSYRPALSETCGGLKRNEIAGVFTQPLLALMRTVQTLPKAVDALFLTQPTIALA